MIKFGNIKISSFFYLFLILLHFTSCKSNIRVEEECLKSASEKYLEVSIDSLDKKATNVLEILLKKFNEKSVNTLNFEAYQLIYFSSFEYGKSIRFENNNGNYLIKAKCVDSEYEEQICEEYTHVLDESDWLVLEKMIYEFNFWTEESFRSNLVLDGHVFLLEGKRNEAVDCKRRNYKVIARGSPRYDKIGSLCESILEFEDYLYSNYRE